MRSNFQVNHEYLQELDASSLTDEQRGRLDTLRTISAQIALRRGLQVAGTKVSYVKLQATRQQNIRTSILDEETTANDLLRMRLLANNGQVLAEDYGLEETDGQTFARLRADLDERLEQSPAYQSAQVFLGVAAAAAQTQTVA